MARRWAKSNATSWVKATPALNSAIRREMRSSALRLAVCLHAGLYGMSGHSLEVETAQKAIELADWFVALQMEILTGGQVAARRPELEEVCWRC